MFIAMIESLYKCPGFGFNFTSSNGSCIGTKHRLLTPWTNIYSCTHKQPVQIRHGDTLASRIYRCSKSSQNVCIHWVITSTFSHQCTRDLSQCFCVFVSFAVVYAQNGCLLCVHIALKLWLSSSFPQPLLIPSAASQYFLIKTHLRGAMSMCTLYILPELYVQNKLFCRLSTAPDEVIDMVKKKLRNYTIYKNNAQSVSGVILFMCITFFFTPLLYE